MKMDKVLYSSIILSSLMLCISQVKTSERTKPTGETCFNACVSLETNDWNNAITGDIRECIYQRVAVICTTSLFST